MRGAQTAFVVAVGSVLMLSGCGGEESERSSGAATAETSGGSVEVSGEVTVFAAASLTDVFADLAADFEAEYPGTDVTVSTGGSSALAQQIVAGAPVDVFAAAAPGPMDTVMDAGLATDPTIFASNSLELVVAAGNPLGITGLEDLATEDLTVALCDAEVPCGSAAEATLEAAGVTAAPDTLERDVRAVLTKVELGEVDVGLVYRSDVLAAGSEVTGVELPITPESTNDYPVAVLGGAANAAAGAAFVELLRSPDGAEALRQAGFGVP